MKVCQVVTGLIPVPNNRWGATEKVMWNYKMCLQSLGVQCDVLYLNEVEKDKYDIVHIHMANLALEAKKRGIPYIFSIHDHHTEYHGKGSHIYNQNLEAIKGSVFSLTHAEHYLDLFDGTDKLFYLSHGVNTSLFVPAKHENVSEFKLLMVANNGLAGDYTFDRKGFILGIQAAKALDLPITIIGAESNRKFFELRTDKEFEYEKLTINYDNPTDDVIRKAYQEHHIFLHPSFLEAGHPNLTLLEAMSCDLPIVATYKGSKNIPRIYKMEYLTTECLIDNIKKAINFYPFPRYEYYESVKKSFDWINITRMLLNMYQYSILNKNVLPTEIIKQKYLNTYQNLMSLKNSSL